jgi:hypothetical protein
MRLGAMRKITNVAVLVLLAIGSWAQQNPAPQTARQALLEMFFSKTPGTFARHLPAATIAALEKAGAMDNVQQFSLMASQLQSQRQNIQTFETGSVLVSAQDLKTGQKFEVTVENDALRGDEDDIDLSFQMYKDGQAQSTPFMPQMTFAMKQEAQIWKLNEISVTIHVPLADPELLKAITEKMKSQASGPSFTPQRPMTASSVGSDAMVLAAMRKILTAEATYAASYPTVGYSCTLSDLDGFGSAERNEHQAMLIDSGLASGKRYGFIFTLSGCNGTPATSFHLTAAPNANTFGRKAFCADQSAAIRSSENGNPETCLRSGTPVQ